MSLTKRRADIINAILRYQRQHGGKSPSFREVADAVGIRTLTLLSYHIHRLQAQGYLAPRACKATRALQVLKTPYEIIYRMADGELILGPLGRERLAAARSPSAAVRSPSTLV